MIITVGMMIWTKWRTIQQEATEGDAMNTDTFCYNIYDLHNDNTYFDEKEFI